MKTINDTKNTDQKMCLLIQQKNKAGFTKLYTQYGCVIYGLALKAFPSEEFAEEVVELTFLNVWNSIHLFKHQQKTFCAWLICIFISTSKDYLVSKNIKFTVNSENFPGFAFDIIEEEAC